MDEDAGGLLPLPGNVASGLLPLPGATLPTVIEEGKTLKRRKTRRKRRTMMRL